MDAKPILYVDDSADDLFFMQQAFKELGLPNKLIGVESGQEAIDYLNRVGEFKDWPLPRLVLLDLNMPGKSGFEVLKWIRTHPPVSTLPVVVLTSSNYDADVHRAYRLGANAYLLKPAAPEKLVGVLKTLKDFWLTLNQPPPDPGSM